MRVQPPFAARNPAHPFACRCHFSHPPHHAIECTANAFGRDTFFGFPTSDAKHHSDGVLDVGIAWVAVGVPGG
eukprot:7796130-Lingulodinium_polyedra.AAC.1